MNTVNNNCTGGWVIVSLVGDVYGPNGFPDGKVNILDVSFIARRFGATPSSPLWNANADIGNYGMINIIDVSIAARNFGQQIPWPP